ncbi:Ig-like domain-containing protein [Azospira inquinata]|uniref:Ig-like domain repeat protein n=1 Tax=Azospira inquinata TaxID=2785627 RepID=A0A975SM83_9RHOO|nr:Ig-like domain-containing protein [Azospira inquinata]QWT46001.1 Ig-like domain repeat protein [Azospira inquinata]QWT48671.1 Ig-like domain repeat protein [Azospira inquinata]
MLGNPGDPKQPNKDDQANAVDNSQPNGTTSSSDGMGGQGLAGDSVNLNDTEAMASPDAAVSSYLNEGGDNGTPIAVLSNDAAGYADPDLILNQEAPAFGFVAPLSLLGGAAGAGAAAAAAALASNQAQQNGNGQNGGGQNGGNGGGQVATPTITSLEDSVGSVQGAVAPNGVTDDTHPILNGTAPAGTTIQVYDNGNLLGSTTADSTGHWAYTPTTSLVDGPHSFTVTATNSAGTVSPASSAYGITVDTVAPAAPVISSLSDDVGSVQGTVANGGQSDDPTPSLTGTAEAGSTVQIYDGAALLGSTTADSTGHWSYTPATGLTEGAHSFTAVATDPAGNRSGASSAYGVTLDYTAPSGTTGALDPSSDTGTLGDNLTSDTTPTLTGAAEAGAQVEVTVNGKTYSTTADSTGHYSITVPNSDALTDGSYTPSIKVTDAAGNSSTTAGTPFTIDHTAPTAPVITTVTDNVGAVTGALTNGATTDDATPTVQGTAEAGSTVAIYDGATLLGSTTADNNGNWTYTPATPLLTGSHGLTAVAEDAAGNQSGVSNRFDLTLIGSGAPAAPAILNVLDDVGPITGNVTKDSGVTDDAHPEIKGTAEAGATIQVYDNGTLLGSTTADSTGNWSYTPTTALTDGPHGITATATNGAGNTSPSTGVYGFSVDTTAPSGTTGALDPSSDTGTPGDNLTSDTTPTVTGAAEAGAKVEVTVNGKTYSTTADSTGHYSVTVPSSDALTDGSYTPSIKVTDAAGNSSTTAGTPFTIDHTAPAAPVITTVTDNVGAVTGALTNGATTDDATPTVQGTAEAGSTVAIYDGATLLGSTTADNNGNWTYTPATPLLTGSHGLTAVAEDAAGNQSGVSNRFDLTLIGSGAPAAPAILNVLDDVGPITGNVTKDSGVTDDAHPEIKGTAEAGATIQVYDNGTLLGSTTADSTGNWSYTPTTALTDGPHGITATATNGAGNTSPSTGVYGFSVDTTAPNAPVIKSVTDDVGAVQGTLHSGATTDDATPTLNGTGEAGATIKLYDGSTLLGSTTVDSNGNWSYTPTQPLTDGAHSLSATQTDVAGNTSPSTNNFPFTVDTSSVSTPTIITVQDSEGPIQGAVPQNGVTDDAHPTLNGTAPAGTRVKVYDNGVELGSVVADSHGYWAYVPSVLTDGPHSFTVTATNSAGTVSPSSSAYGITVDTVAPAAPVISSLSDDVGSVQGTVANGGQSDDPTPSLSGTAEAGATVQVYDNGSLLGSTVATSSGTWSYTPATGLTEGAHSFTAVATDVAGNRSGASSAYGVTLDYTAPSGTTGALDPSSDTGKPGDNLTSDTTPTVTGAAEAGAKVEVTVNGKTYSTTADSTGHYRVTVPNSDALTDGSYTPSIKVTDAAGNSSTTAGTPFTIDSTAPTGTTGALAAVAGNDTGTLGDNLTSDTTPTLTGAAEAGAQVEVTVNGKTYSTTADSTGHYSITVPNSDALTDGSYTPSIKVTDAAGNSSTTAGTPFTIDHTAPAVPVITTVTDDVGAVQGTLHSGATTDDATPTLNGTGEAGATVKLYDGSTLLGSTTVDSNGNWTYTPTTPLTDGAHSLSATQTDVAGNTSPSTNNFPFTVDTSSVSTPTIITVQDSEGPIQGAVPQNGVTDDAHPTLNGTAPAGTTVKVYDNGVELGSVVADSHGYWAYVPSVLVDGTHSFTVTATNSAGTVSPASSAYGITVDTVAPAAPVISSLSDDVGSVQGTVANGGQSDDPTPSLTGTAEAGSTVQIYDGAALLGSTTADSTGHWSYTPATGLTEGAHSFTAVATDPAGNRSGASSAYGVTLDYTAPSGTTGALDPSSDTGTLGDNLTSDTTPTLTGAAEAGAQVEVTVNGKTYSTTADSTGHYSITVPNSDALTDGSYTPSIKVTDAAGNSSTTAGTPFTIDHTAPTAPVITTVTDNVGAVTGALTNGATTDDATPTVQGTAEAGSTVAIYDGATLLGSTTADNNGNWTYTPATPLLTGSHGLTAVAEDGAGNQSGVSNRFDLTLIGSGAPAAPAILNVLDDVGPITGNVTKDSGVTDDAHPEIKGTAEAGATIQVYDNGSLLGSTTADSTGNWSYTPTTALTDGPHGITATATNGAGNTSPSTGVYGFSVDTTAPSGTTGALDPSSDTGTLGDNLTSDTTPTVTGAAEAGAQVEVTVNGKTYSTTADSTGHYSVTVPSSDALTDGSYTPSIKVTDAAGNSSTTQGTPFTIDHTAPTAPVITTVTDNVGAVTGALTNGATTDDATPTVQGTAEAGSTVAIYDGATLLGSTTADNNGNWTYTPATPLLTGSHGLTAVAEDAAGNQSGVSNRFDLTLIGSGAPAAPAILNVLDDVGPITGNVTKDSGVTDDAHPEIKGTAEAGATIQVYDNGTLLGSTTADSTGNWSYTPTTALTDGPHGITATATNGAGNTSPSTGVYGFSVDTTAPNAPVIKSVTDDVGAVQGTLHSGATTDDATPTLNGTGEAGATIKLYDGSTLLGSTTVDSNGNWTYTPTTPLTDGAHSLSATQTDVAGNTSPSTNNFPFTVDTSSVSTPTIITVQDSEGPIQGAVPQNGVTDDAHPTLNGTAPAGTTVKVYDNGVELGSVVADSHGYWAYVPSVLVDGTHSFTVTATNSAGTVSPASSAYGITVDTVAPAAPVISSLSDDVGSVQGTVANGGQSDDPTPSLTGTAEAGSTVQIYDGAALLGSTTADSTGHWSYTPATGLTEGAHSFTAVATDPAGNRSGASSAYGVTLDYTAPSGTTGALDPSSDTGTLGDNLTSDTTPTLTGAAEAGAQVEVTVNGKTYSTTADSTGHYSITVPNSDALTDGSYTPSIKVTDAAGNSSTTAGTPFTIDHTAPTAPVITTVTDNVGAVTGALTNGATTDDATPTVQGTAEAGSTVAIYDGATLLGSTTADNNGNWTYTPATPLLTGSHGLTAVAEDAAGNQSGVSNRFDLTLIGSGAPAAPAILNVLDDVGPITGNVTKDSGVTDDAHPEIKGTAEAGATIQVYDNGTLLGSTTADSTGNWSYTPTTALTDGPHGITATATNGAGNTSPSTGVYGFSVDTTAPNAPVIKSVTDDVGAVQGTLHSGATTDDATPTLNGTGEAGATIKLYDGSTLLGSTTVDSNGNWSYTPTQPLTDGAHSLSATQTDVAGNTSPSTNNFPFTVDTSSVSTPTIITVQDSEGPIQGAVPQNGVTDDAHPTLNGTAPAGTRVKVYDNGVELGSVVADSHGYWAYVPSVLTDGPHSFTVTATNSAGTVSPSSSAYGITVDTVAPAAPVISSLSDDVGSVQGTVANGGQSDDPTPSLSGTAEAGATVQVYDNGSLLGSTVATSSGTWSYTPATGLTEGAHSFTAVATDVAGNRSGASSAYGVTLDYTAPSGTTGALDPSSDTGKPGDNLTSDTTPTVTGAAEAGAKVEVTVNGKTYSTTADSTGHYRVTVPNSDALTDGSYTPSIKVTDAAGNSSTTAGTPFTIDSTAPTGTTGALAAVAGNDTGTLGDNLTSDTTPTLTGAAEAGAQVEVTVNGKTYSTTADSTGHYSITVPNSDALTDGSYTPSIKVTDAAGNSSTTAGTPFTIDHTAPAVPVITTVTDDVGAVQGTLHSGATTDDATPTLNGTGEAGATVKLYDGSTLLGSTTVDSNGNWTYTPTTPLTDGAHSLSATQTDVAGNTSPSTNNFPFTVDTSSVSTPTIITVQDSEGPIQGAVPQNGVTDDAHPTLNGTAPAGTTVKVYDNGVELGSVVADSHGYWAYVPSVLVDGTHSFTVTATNSAGTVSPASSAYGITVDTVAPAAPVISSLSDDVGSVQGTVANGGQSDDPTPSLTGTAEAGSTVQIYDGAALLGSTTADSTGHWSYTPATGLTEGAHSFTAVATDPAGNRSGASSAYGVTLDYTAPSGTTGALDPSSDTGTLGDNLTSDTTPTLTGAAEAGAQVEVTVNGKTYSTTADSTGHYSITVPNSDALTDGSYTPSIKVTDAAGNSSTTAGTPFTIDHTAPTAPVITTVTDNVGAVTGALTNGATTDDATPTVQGTAEAGSTVAIYDGATLLGSTTADNNGNWTYTPATPLLTGSHGLTAVAEDAAGNQSGVSNRFDLTLIGSGAPAAPAILNVLDDVGPITGNVTKDSGVTDDAHPEIKGTAEAGATIQVYDNGTLLGSTTADSTGNWSYTPTTALTDGPHGITATATNGAGNTSPSTGVYGFSVDTTAPNAPVIKSVTDDVGAVQGTLHSGATTDDATPTLNGTGEAGATIKLYDGSTLLGSTTVDSNGNWSYTPTQPLTDGAHSLSATQTDVAGNTSPSTNNFPFTVDTSSVSTPTIITVQDSEGPIQGAVPQNGVTDDAHPTLNGTAPAGTRVKVYDNGVELGSVVADSHGYWAYVPSVLTDGPHSFTVTATNSAGTVSPSSSAYGITVDTVAPAAPVISSLSDDVGSVQGTVANGGQSDDPTPSLSGTAEAGATVQVYDNGSLLGSTVATSSGTWSYTPATGLTEGAHSFTAVATDVAGNRSGASSAYGVTLDYTAPSGTTGALDPSSDTGKPGDNLTSDTTPTVTGAAEAGAKVEVTVNGKTYSTTADSTGHYSVTVPNSDALTDGSYTPSIKVTDAAGNSSTTAGTPFTIDHTAPTAPAITTVSDNVGSVQGTVANGGQSDDPTPSLTGTAEAGSTVQIYDGAALLGSTTADSTGHWSYTPATGLTEGAHSFTAVATDPAGNRSGASSAYGVTLDYTAPSGTTGALDPSSDTGKPGDNLTSDTTPTLTGAAEAGAQVEVTVNGKTYSTTADSTGHYSVTVPNSDALTDGSYTPSIKVTDAAGNSSTTAGTAFTIDSTAPAAPVITTVKDDVGAVQGTLHSGAITDDATPTLNGTGEAGATVKLYDGSTLLGSTTVDSNGNWTYTPTTHLADGTHSISATQTDGAGNTSPSTNNFPFTVDTSAVGLPAITSLQDDVGSVQGAVATNGVTDDTQPTLSGTAPKGTTIQVYDNGYALGTTTVDSTGHWTYTPTTSLADGRHTFTVTATNGAGTVSAGSAAYAVTVDTTAPAAPAITTVSDNVGSVQGTVANGGQSDDPTPSLSGTAEAGSTVQIYDGATLLGSTVASSSGTWSYTPATGLTEGAHSFTAVATDPAGNRSGASSAYGVTLDYTAPSGTTGALEPSSDTGKPGDNLTSDTTPTVTGAAEAGAKVEVTVNGKTYSTTADSTGHYRVTVPNSDALTDGSYTPSIKVTDAAGNSSTTQGTAFTIDSTAPTGTTGALAAVAGNDTGTLGDNLTSDTTPTVTGAAEAGAKVEVTINGKTYSTTADSTGHYSVTVPSSDALTDGSYTPSIKVTDAAGNSSTTQGTAFTIDSTAPTGTTGALAAVAGNDTGTLGDNLTSDTTPTVTGAAEAGAKVEVTVNGKTYSTTADSTGHYRVTVPNSDALTDGSYTPSIKVTDAAGNSSTTAGTPFTIDHTAPSAPVITAVMDNVGSIQGALTNGGQSDDSTPSLSGTAEKGSTVQIYDGNTLLGTTTADSSGNWSYTPGTGLAEGAHSFTAVATDPAGNRSSSSSAFNVTLDYTAPAAPVISSILDNVGAQTGNLASGAMADDPTPTLQGTAEANSAITIYDGNTIIGQTVTNGAGNWTFTPTVTGFSHQFSVTATDTAGNVSGHSANFVYNYNNPPVAIADQATITIPTQAVFYYSYGNTLGYFDPATGARTIINGNTGHALNGLAVASDGTLYATSGTEAGNLYKINTSTGAATLVSHYNAGGQGLYSLCADGNGMLYGTGSDGRLYSINPLTGATTQVGTFGSYSTAGDLLYSNNAIYMSTIDNKLVEYDLSTNTVSVIISALPARLNGLGRYGDGTVYGITDAGGVYTIDLTNGVATNTGITITGSPAVSDAASTVTDGVTATINGDVTPGTADQDYDPDGNAISVTGVVAGNSAAAAGGLNTVIHGVYGNLVMQADGTYKYTVDGTLATTQALEKASNGVHTPQAYYVDAGGNIGILDPTTGASHVLGYSGVGALYDIATTPDGKLYGITNGDILYSIDTTTGAATKIGSSGIAGFASYGLVSDSNGLLYDFGTNGAIYTVDKATGKATYLDRFNVNNTGWADDGIYYNNALYAVTTSGQLVKYDLSTHATTVVMSGLPGNMYGMEVGGNGIIYGFRGDGEIYTYDLNAGTYTDTGLTIGHSIYGTASAAVTVDASSLFGQDVFTYTITDEHGQTSTTTLTINVTDSLNTVTGGTGNDVIHNIGGGQFDQAYGQAGDDTIGIASSQFATVSGGTGTDTLAFESGNISLNLANVGSKVQGFEVFDLGSNASTTAHNSLSLRAADVLTQLSGDGASIHLEVKGESTDTVHLLATTSSSSWAQTGTQTAGGITYNVYHDASFNNTAADVWVQQGIAVTYG